MSSVGRASPAILMLTFALAATSAHAACSCTAMTVIDASADHTATICSNSNLNFTKRDECTVKDGHRTTECSNFTWAYTCPVGPNFFVRNQRSVGFVVDASYTGNANQCHTGHTLQLTITSNNQVLANPKVHAAPTGNVTIGTLQLSITSDNRNPSPPFPQIDSKNGTRRSVGADAYTDINATDQLIGAYNNHIKWWDHTDQTKDKAAENATWHYRYFSYVTGNPGSCVCVMDINVNWPANQDPQVAITRNTALSSSNCNF